MCKLVLLGDIRYNTSKKGLHMGAKIKYNNGDDINGFIYICDEESKIVGNKGHKSSRRFIRVTCPHCKENKILRHDNVKLGTVESCGCEFVRKRKEGNKKRWFSDDAKLLSLRHNYMMQRCYNKNHKSYHNYGGRGVRVCAEWHDKKTFVEWGLKNGFNKKLDLDKDIKGDGMLYSPDTCCFVTRKENNKHKRTLKQKSKGVSDG